MSNSTVETGTTWSPRSALPARWPTVFTPFTESMSLSAISASSCVVSSDVPGAVVIATMSVSSLKLGRNSFGMALNSNTQ